MTDEKKIGLADGENELGATEKKGRASSFRISSRFPSEIYIKFMLIYESSVVFVCCGNRKDGIDTAACAMLDEGGGNSSSGIGTARAIPVWFVVGRRWRVRGQCRSRSDIRWNGKELTLGVRSVCLSNFGTQHEQMLKETNCC